MKGLSERQKVVLALFRERALDFQPPPTIDALRATLGCVSPGTVDGIIKRCIGKGVLRPRMDGAKGAVYVPTPLEMLLSAWTKATDEERGEFMKQTRLQAK